jgi:hypothetical protein
VDMTDLWYFGERNDLADYLSSRGWTTTAVVDLYVANGLKLEVPSASDEKVASSFSYITAIRT